MSDGVIRYVQSPTARAFHRCNERVRAIKGPVGSGKSSMSVMEVLFRAMAQEPFGGVRRVRGLAIRNTFAELKSTTIKTFEDWLGGMGRVTYGSPITFTCERVLPDDTLLELEVYFLPLDRPADVRKLKSLEVTFAWINEASEVPYEVLKVLRGRIGRFPSARLGGPTWSGIWMDYNPPPIRSPWYRLFEVERPKGHRIFHQPGGLLIDPENPGQYLPNPEAENIANLEGGYDYYFNQTHGAPEDYVNVMVLGNYGATFDGKPVFSQFDQAAHVALDPLAPPRSGTIVVGMDFGLNPAAVFTSLTPNGGIQVLDELAPTSITLEEFVNELLVPKIAERFGRANILVVGDPAGRNRSALSKLNSFQVLRSRGIAAQPAPTNDWIPRRDAVSFFLTRRHGYIMSPACVALREAMAGGYRFKKAHGAHDVFKLEPEKDHHSHIADALQYAALYYHHSVVRPYKRPRLASSAKSERAFIYA